MPPAGAGRSLFFGARKTGYAGIECPDELGAWIGQWRQEDRPDLTEIAHCGARRPMRPALRSITRSSAAKTASCTTWRVQAAIRPRVQEKLPRRRWKPRSGVGEADGVPSPSAKR